MNGIIGGSSRVTLATITNDNLQTPACQVRCQNRVLTDVDLRLSHEVFNVLYSNHTSTLSHLSIKIILHHTLVSQNHGATAHLSVKIIVQSHLSIKIIVHPHIRRDLEPNFCPSGVGI